MKSAILAAVLLVVCRRVGPCSADRLSQAEMTQSAILTKLEKLLAHGIRSEPEAVYLLVETRKLLEQQDTKKRYEYLTFHCDWGLHAKLTGSTAQRILKLFDNANVHLKAGAELEQRNNCRAS